MFTTIDSNVLETVNGGAGRPQYLASRAELERRSRMTADERARADAEWRKTFASLSRQRRDAIRQQATTNAIVAFPPPVVSIEV